MCDKCEDLNERVYAILSETRTTVTTLGEGTFLGMQVPPGFKYEIPQEILDLLRRYVEEKFDVITPEIRAEMLGRVGETASQFVEDPLDGMILLDTMSTFLDLPTEDKIKMLRDQLVEKYSKVPAIRFDDGTTIYALKGTYPGMQVLPAKYWEPFIEGKQVIYQQPVTNNL